MEEIKCVVVGDAGIGKTCLIHTYITNEFPSLISPEEFDMQEIKLAVKNKWYSLQIWDTPGKDEFDVIRPRYYPGTQVFVICFAIDDISSYEHVNSKWIHEIRQTLKAPLVLVGLRADLRDDEETLKRVPKWTRKYVRPPEGSSLARKIGAVYIECSALTKGNVEKIFEMAVDAAVQYRSHSRGRRCQLL